MPSISPVRPLARAHARVVVGALVAICACIVAAPAAGADDTYTPAKYALLINDHIALPGEREPDSVVAFDHDDWEVPYESQTVRAGAEVRRNGVVIEPAPPAGDGRLDLAVGDEIRIVNIKPGYPASTLATYVYDGLPKLDAPVCAGNATYRGSRELMYRYIELYATAVLWKHRSPSDPQYPGYPGYPGYPQYPGYPGYPQYPGYPDYPGYPHYPGYPEYPGYDDDLFYPGWAPGFHAAQVDYLNGGGTSPGRFSISGSTPLAAGTHLYVGDATQPIPGVAVYTEKDHLVVDCSAQIPESEPVVSPTPAATPISTPAPSPSPAATPVVTPTPTVDSKAPTGSVTGPTAAALKQLGVKALLRGGVPLIVKTDEPAQLKGTISALGGRTAVRADVRISLQAGTTNLKVTVPNALRRAIKAVPAKKTPKLQLKLTLVDAAGNVARLTTITIKLPKN